MFFVSIKIFRIFAICKHNKKEQYSRWKRSLIFLLNSLSFNSETNEDTARVCCLPVPSFFIICPASHPNTGKLSLSRPIATGQNLTALSGINRFFFIFNYCPAAPPCACHSRSSLPMRQVSAKVTKRETECRASVVATVGALTVSR